MGPDNSPPQIVPLNYNNKKGPDNLHVLIVLSHTKGQVSLRLMYAELRTNVRTPLDRP